MMESMLNSGNKAEQSGNKAEQSGNKAEQSGNKALLEALYTYQSPVFDSRQQMVVVTHENGRREAISIHQACEMAADLIEQRDLDAEKFRYLVAQFRRYKHGALYRFLMGEDLPE